MAQATWDAATTSVLMGARVPILSPNDHPNPFQRQQKDFGENKKFLKNFSRCMPT